MIKKFRVLVLIATALIIIFHVPTKAEPDDKIIVVSIGDSYSAGEGLGDYYDENLIPEQRINSEGWIAHRSKKAWPGRLTFEGMSGSTLAEHPDQWYFAAVSGAETEHFFKRQEKKFDFSHYKGAQLLSRQQDVFSKVKNGTVDYVTVTFGGNDLGFVDILNTAGFFSSYLNPNWVNDQISNSWKKYYRSTKDDLKKIYKKIHELAGDQAQIIVAGYPCLFDKEGKGFFFSQYEAQIINTSITKFNDEIEKIVQECKKEGIKIDFISVEEAFKNHGAYTPESDDGGAFINGLTFKTDQDIDQSNPIGAASFHPNDKGAAAYAACVQAFIDNQKKQAGGETNPQTEEESPQEPVQEAEIVMPDKDYGGYDELWQADYSIIEQETHFDPESESSVRAMIKSMDNIRSLIYKLAIDEYGINEFTNYKIGKTTWRRTLFRENTDDYYQAALYNCGRGNISVIEYLDQEYLHVFYIVDNVLIGAERINADGTLDFAGCLPEWRNNPVTEKQSISSDENRMSNTPEVFYYEDAELITQQLMQNNPPLSSVLTSEEWEVYYAEDYYTGDMIIPTDSRVFADNLRRVNRLHFYDDNTFELAFSILELSGKYTVDDISVTLYPDSSEDVIQMELGQYSTSGGLTTRSLLWDYENNEGKYIVYLVNPSFYLGG